MLIRLSKNTFLRFRFDSAYLINQMTRYDRVYDEIGADFLREISRQPREIDEIIKSLASKYDAPESQIREDFIEFVVDLERNFFVVTGENVENLDANDIEFKYANGNMKTQLYDYKQQIYANQDDRPTPTQYYNMMRSREKPHVYRLQFELTSRCNERCIHCYIPNGKKNEGTDMPFEKFKAIIDEFSDNGGLIVSLSGGEAFLHKDIIKMIQYCREKDMMIVVLSNLLTLRDSQIPLLKETNVSLMQTSLYSVDPEIHDMITTIKGSCERTKAAIEKLVAADIPVQISCPTMKANYKGYKDVLRYAQSLNIKATTDFIMMAQADKDTSNLAQRLSLEETEELLRDIMEYDIDYRNLTQVEKPLTDEIMADLKRFATQPICGAGINDCCVTEDGQIYPCAGWQDYVVGNVFDKPLKEIWETSEKVEELRHVTWGSFPECMECDANEFCAPCLVRNYNESNGDMLKIPEHACQVAKLTKRIFDEYHSKGLI